MNFKIADTRNQQPKMDTIDVSRYEYKYLLTPDEVPEVRRFLLRYCSADVYAQGAEWYGIQSLYFDTPTKTFFRASAEQAVERMKLRVRGYSTGTGPVKLEIKKRVGDVVSKSSLVVSRDTLGAVRKHGVTALPPSRFVTLIEQVRATPKVLVEYERHALFSSIDDYVRVTFDRRIVCQSMHDWKLDGNPRLWRSVDDPASFLEDSSTYVLELKFKVAAPVWLRELVTRFGLVRRGFSKYTRGVQRLSRDRDPAWDLRTPAFTYGSKWRVA